MQIVEEIKHTDLDISGQLEQPNKTASYIFLVLGG